MVYFIREEGTSNVKIGKADCPKSRLSSLSSGNHRKLNLELVLEGGFELENNLHKVFKDRNIRNEWFLFENKINEDIVSSELRCYAIMSKVLNEVKKRKAKKSSYLLIEDCIESLINNTDKQFITKSIISNKTNLSISTVKNNINSFKGIIKDYNLKNFNTNNRSEFNKSRNIDTIKEAVKEIGIGATRRDVSNYTYLHYNTVKSLWKELEIV